MTDNVVRPIHYLGSKLRLLDGITKAVDDLDPLGGPVCDLFCGSGTVSKSFLGNRDVISSDIQNYSEVLCDALMLSTKQMTSTEDLVEKAKTKRERILKIPSMQDLLEFEIRSTESAAKGDVRQMYTLIEQGSIYGISDNADRSTSFLELVRSAAKSLQSEEIIKETQVLRYFGGLYYSYSQALDIDCLIWAIKESTSVCYQKELAAILSTASETVNSVGNQFAQPIKVRDSKGNFKTRLAGSIIAARTKDVYKCFEKWVSYYFSLNDCDKKYSFLRMDYTETLRELKNKPVSVVYADPPYTRYHYSRYYHVLETICLQDLPLVSNTCRNGGTGYSRAMYRRDRHQSPFCIKSQAETAFDRLFKGVSELGVPLVLSYSPFTPSQAVTPRLQTIDQLIEKASFYFGDVEVRSPGKYAHSKFNSSDKNFEVNDEAELLLLFH